MHQLIATSQHFHTFQNNRSSGPTWSIRCVSAAARNVCGDHCEELQAGRPHDRWGWSYGTPQVQPRVAGWLSICSTNTYNFWGSHVRKSSFEDLFMMKLLLSPGSGTASTVLPTWCWICCRRSSTPPMRPGRASWNCARRSTCRRSPSKLGRDVTVTCSRKQPDLEWSW